MMRRLSPSSNSRNHEGRAIVLADVVNAENIGMAECGDGTGFLLETPEAVGIGGEGGGQNLDGDIASQALIAGAVNLAHSASTDECNEFVGSEFRTGSERHEVCCIIA